MSMRFGDVHAQAHRLDAFDESLVATAMPLPAVLDSFLWRLPTSASRKA